jgi:hypothetical protein
MTSVGGGTIRDVCSVHKSNSRGASLHAIDATQLDGVVVVLHHSNQ